jgi:hypothetical protein
MGPRGQYSSPSVPAPKGPEVQVRFLHGGAASASNQLTIIIYFQVLDIWSGHVLDLVL